MSLRHFYLCPRTATQHRHTSVQARTHARARSVDYVVHANATSAVVQTINISTNEPEYAPRLHCLPALCYNTRRSCVARARAHAVRVHLIKTRVRARAREHKSPCLWPGPAHNSTYVDVGLTAQSKRLGALWGSSCRCASHTGSYDL